MSHTHQPPDWIRPQSLRSWAFALLCFLATLAPQAAFSAARLEVRSASVALESGVYVLDAALDVWVPDSARRAIAAGLTMRLDYEVDVQRSRRYVPDADVADLTQSFELGYHALSQRYLLRNLNSGEQQDFGTLDAALERLAEVRSLPVIDASLLERDERYELRVRASLRLSSVPDALGWLMFWGDDWSSTSDWYTWTLRP